MVVAYVTVHGCAGIIASPSGGLGIHWAVLRVREGRGSFMAAGCPETVLWVNL